MAASYLQTPWKSGSPQPVRGGTKPRDSDAEAVVEFRAVKASANAAIPTPAANVSTTATDRYLMSDLRHLFACPVAGSTTPRWPYIASSTNSTHLYSRIRLSFSTRR